MENGKCYMVALFLNKRVHQIHVFMNENEFRNVPESSQSEFKSSLNKKPSSPYSTNGHV